MQSTIHKLRISRRDVPQKVPFSVVYLYQEHDRATIRAAFPALFELRPINLRLEDWEGVRVHTQDPRDRREYLQADDMSAPTLRDVVPDLFASDSPWYLGIPTLVVSGAPRKSQPRGHQNIGDDELPEDGKKVAYMGQRGNWESQKKAPPIPVPNVRLDPIFAVRGQEDEGVCSQCPRYAHNAAGKCFFGDPVCFQHIRALGAPSFVSHLSKLTKDDDGLPQRQSPANHGPDGAP